MASGTGRATNVARTATSPHSDRRIEARQDHIDALLFNVPDVPLFLIAGDECIARHEPALRARPWVRLVPVKGDDLRPAVERLRGEEGIQRVSAIGGRFTATQLVDAGLIQDIYLTTTSLEGGEPGTPVVLRDEPTRAHGHHQQVVARKRITRRL